MINSPYQWQMVRANFDPVRGSEQAGIRPALIVSREAINTSLTVVAVVSVTTWRPGRRLRSTEVLLPAGIAGQPNASIVMAQQVRVVAKERLLGSYGYLNDEALREQIRMVLKTYLDLL